MKQTKDTSNNSHNNGVPEGEEAKESSKIQSPHDAVFQDFWDEKEVASSFIKEYVPEKITRHLDFESLKISKDSFIDNELDRYFSDILYEI